MPTPNWDTLHTRFATSVRDGVSAASISGLELTVADRDSYLNYAYNKYVGLVSMYNPDAVERILPDLFQRATITGSAGIANLPSDFGSNLSVSSQGIDVNKPEVRQFKRIQDSSTLQNPPSVTNIYISPRGTVIDILPTSITVNLDITYLIKPQVITEGGANDIVLTSNHWDTIIQLARAQYYRDKSEFDVAQSMEQDALINSPFKIGEIKK